MSWVAPLANIWYECAHAWQTIHPRAIRRLIARPSSILLRPSFHFPKLHPTTLTPSAVGPSAWRKRPREATLPFIISIMYELSLPSWKVVILIVDRTMPTLRILMSDEDLPWPRSIRLPSAGIMSAPLLWPVLVSSPMLTISSLSVWLPPCWVLCTGKMQPPSPVSSPRRPTQPSRYILSPRN